MRLNKIKKVAQLAIILIITVSIIFGDSQTQIAPQPQTHHADHSAHHTQDSQHDTRCHDNEIGCCVHAMTCCIAPMKVLAFMTIAQSSQTQTAEPIEFSDAITVPKQPPRV
jgi:hypothetical protein